MPTLRPLSDILGIKYPHHCSACECDPSENPISVDEILAWLQQECPGDFVFGEDHPGGGYFVFAYWDCSVGGYDGEERGWEIEVRHAPTLLGALEETVRKIDDFRCE